jgi:polar amino acid transport system substrate-binding protein
MHVHNRDRNFLLRICCLVLCSAALATAAMAAYGAESCKQLVATGNPEYPPYLWRDQADQSHLIGANADLMQMLSKEIGIPIDIQYVGSWARVQEEARLGRVDLIVGAFFTVQRLDYMDYFYPAFLDTRSVIWTRRGAGFNYKKWIDLRPYSGITVINNSFGEDFDSFAKKSLKISSVPSLEQAFKMLQAERVDYLIYEEDPGLAYIAKLDIAGLAPVYPPISNESLYLTLSHKSPCNTPEVRGLIAKAMYRLARQNLMKKRVEANIQLWRVK